MAKQRPLNQSDSWMLGEDIPDMDFSFSEIWLSCFANEFQKPNGRAYRKVLSVYRGYHLWFYYGEQDSNEVGEHIVQRFLANPKFIIQVNRAILHWSDQLRRYAERLPETGLAELPNRKLWELYAEHDRLHTTFYQWGWIPVAADMFHANFTEKLKQYLRDCQVPDDRLNEVFVNLTQPKGKSLIQIEREEFLQLALAVQGIPSQRRLFEVIFDRFREQEAAKYGYETHTREYEALLERKVGELIDQIQPAILKRIQKHYAKYFYVNRMWVGQVSSFESYLKELVKLIGNRANIRETMATEARSFRDAQAKRQAAIKRWGIRGKWRTLFDGFGDFMVTKIYRRYAQIYALYKMEYVQKEIARRFKLSLMDVRFMMPGEVHRALVSGKIDRRGVTGRKKYCAVVFQRGRTEVFTGMRARRLARTVNRREVGYQSELRGQTGCVGRATGTARIVIRPKDMAKMKKGDVLVSIATDPDIVPAMKKAAAIVTEQGGVTSHAAIVSRELGIPCVIGTKIATRVLRDGDRVEVDATKGVVRKI